MRIPDNISRNDIVIAINEWVIGSHAERNRKIMYRRLIDGIIFEDLAEEFSLTDRQIKNIVYKCEPRVFRHIPKR